ncbi:MAG: hypothetical protein MJZ24_06235 [Paludibacteraceae bacterium]|nr:hypothetical protein [Paludibacteraceae bacterium]
METSIKRIEKEGLDKVIHNILVEGVSYNYDTDTFIFDFHYDNNTDIVSLSKGIHHLNAFGKCYYYGYEFSKDVDSKVLTKFLKYIKDEGDFQNSEDFSKFIYNAVSSLDNAICLPSYDTFIYPQSISELNRKILSNMARIAQPNLVSIELIKEIPSKIEFDYDRFCVEVLESKNNDGTPKYTPSAKKQTLESIKNMMDIIHQKDYFSIAKDVKNNKYKGYLKKYYKFKDDKDKKIYKSLMNSNVLLFDDIVTTGSTIYYLLNCLRTINDNNNIVIFSLIGNDKANSILI